MMNLLFSMIGPRLTDDQANLFEPLARWVVLNEKGGRLLVDGIGDPANVQTVLGLLTQFGRAPVVIGGWSLEGERVMPLNEPAWLAVAPLDGSDPENPVPYTAFTDIHRWAGWGPKQ